MENTQLSSTFTFIANYKGGVYVRQVAAKDLMAACHIWAEQLVSNQDIPKLNGDAFLQSFRDDMEILLPVSLQNTSNVWAFSVANRRAFMLVNIVKTAESEAGVAPLQPRPDCNDISTLTEWCYHLCVRYGTRYGVCRGVLYGVRYFCHPGGIRPLYVRFSTRVFPRRVDGSRQDDKSSVHRRVFRRAHHDIYRTLFRRVDASGS